MIDTAVAMTDPSAVAASYWIHNLDPVLLPIYGEIAVRWYGIAYILGFAGFYFLMKLYRRKGLSDFSDNQLESLFTAAVIGVVIGGRLGSMLLYNFGEFVRNPLIFFHFTGGGMAFHGGVVGVILALLFVARRSKLDLYSTSDLLCASVPVGLFFGRIANFINGELWGHPTSLPWGIVFPGAPYDPEAFGFFSQQLQHFVNPRHPSQLYEALAEGILLGLYLQWRLWRTSPPSRVPGQIACEFLIGYALARIACEFFREPDASLIFGLLSRGTFYSILMLAAGIGLLVFVRNRARRLPPVQPDSGVHPRASNR